MRLRLATLMESFASFCGSFGHRAGCTSSSPQGRIIPGVGRKTYDPHSSWHCDGRVHQKSYNRPWMRQQRQRLDSFIGAESFITTSVDQMAAAGLPECVSTEFATVLDLPVGILDVTPGRQQVHIDLVAAGAAPAAVGFGERPLLRWWLNDGAPSIVVSLYEFPSLNLPHRK